MPYLVICPHCSAKLKSGQAVPAGRSLNCPQCKTAFTLSEPAAEVEGTTTTTTVPKPAAAEAPAASPPAASPSPVPAPPPEVKRTDPRPASEPTPRRGHKADVEEVAEAEIVDAADFERKTKPKRSRYEDEDDRPRPRKRYEDDEDDRPRARRRYEDDEDEDDRPRSRKRYEDDEDDRPRARRRDDDEDDRPRSSRRRSENARPGPAGDFDFEDDDRPKAKKARYEDEYDDEDEESVGPSTRSRYKKGKKGNRTLLLLLLGGGAFAMLLVLLAGLYFVDPFGLFGGGASSEMLAWAPEETESIMVVNVADSRDVKELGIGMPITDGLQHGISSDDIDVMMVASRGGFGGQDVVVYKLKSSADREQIINKLGGKEASANGKTYYKTRANGGLYFASSTLVVVANRGSTMESLLEKSSGSIVISDELRTQAGKATGAVSKASVGKAAQTSDLVGMISGEFMMFGAGNGSVKSTLLSLESSSGRASGTYSSTYDSSETAKRVAEKLRNKLDSDTSIRKDIDSYNVSQSGATVTLKISGVRKRGGPGIVPFGLK